MRLPVHQPSKLWPPPFLWANRLHPELLVSALISINWGQFCVSCPPWSNCSRTHSYMPSSLAPIYASQVLLLLCKLFLLGHSLYLSLWTMLRFGPSYGSSGNNRPLSWLLKWVSVPFKGLCPRWLCHRIFKRRTAGVSRHWRESHFHCQGVLRWFKTLVSSRSNQMFSFQVSRSYSPPLPREVIPQGPNFHTRNLLRL